MQHVQITLGSVDPDRSVRLSSAGINGSLVKIEIGEEAVTVPCAQLAEAARKLRLASRGKGATRGG